MLSRVSFAGVLLSGLMMGAWGCETNVEVGRFINGGEDAAAPDADARAAITLEASRARVAANARGACAVTAKGAVKCWGSNDFGTLGTGDDTQGATTTPVVARLAGKAEAVFAGHVATCAVTTERAAECWGDVVYGKFNDFPQSHFVTYDPVRVQGLSEVASIAMGLYFQCALTLSGQVKCWGLGSSGQLGSGGTGDVYIPSDVMGLDEPATAVAVSQGGFFGCAALVDGSVRCWGENPDGQLGTGTTASSKVAVRTLPLPGRAISVGLGRSHACALLEGGRVVCWGANGQRQLGVSGNVVVPTLVPDLDDVAQLAAGAEQTCVRRSAGRVSCFGNGAPIRDVIDGGALEIAAGPALGCALLANERVRCWGEDSSVFNGPSGAPL